MHHKRVQDRLVDASKFTAAQKSAHYIAFRALQFIIDWNVRINYRCVSIVDFLNHPCCYVCPIGVWKYVVYCYVLVNVISFLCEIFPNYESLYMVVEVFNWYIPAKGTKKNKEIWTKLKHWMARIESQHFGMCNRHLQNVNHRNWSYVVSFGIRTKDTFSLINREQLSFFCFMWSNLCTLFSAAVIFCFRFGLDEFFFRLACGGCTPANTEQCKSK